MASINLPGIICWGNPYARLPGALGPSSSHGGGLRAPFFVHWGSRRAWGGTRHGQMFWEET